MKWLSLSGCFGSLFFTLVSFNANAQDIVIGQKPYGMSVKNPPFVFFMAEEDYGSIEQQRFDRHLVDLAARRPQDDMIVGQPADSTRWHFVRMSCQTTLGGSDKSYIPTTFYSFRSCDTTLIFTGYDLVNAFTADSTFGIYDPVAGGVSFETEDAKWYFVRSGDYMVVHLDLGRYWKANRKLLLAPTGDIRTEQYAWFFRKAP